MSKLAWKTAWYVFNSMANNMQTNEHYKTINGIQIEKDISVHKTVVIFLYNSSLISAISCL